MNNVVELKPTSRTLEKELQAYIQTKFDDFIAKTSLYPQDIKISLVTFTRNDGNIDIVVDEVEIKVASVITYEWQDDSH